jgi:hypothetical protein
LLFLEINILATLGVFRLEGGRGNKRG